MRGIRALVAMFVFAATAAIACGQNGGFELGSLSGWTDLSGGAALISGQPEFGFPSEGQWFARLDAGTSAAAAAGHGPHAGGGGAGKTAMLRTAFTRPQGPLCELFIDWTFFCAEAEGDGLFDDFLSIDVVDAATGALVRNVVFVDTGALVGIPPYGNVPGGAAGEIVYAPHAGALEVMPAGFKRARADLSALTTPGQLLRLEVAVGNGGDGARPSFALIDNLVVRAGQANVGAVNTRILGGPANIAPGSSSQVAEHGPYEFRVKPAQTLSIRTHALAGGTPWALLGGAINRQGSVQPFGVYNLFIAGSHVIFDGINPSTPGDVLLGTTVQETTFLGAAVPPDAAPASLGVQALYVDATMPPLFLGATSATDLVVDTTVRIPVAGNDVTSASGLPLMTGTTGLVDLTGLSGGGFTFYGAFWTEVHVSAHGHLSFASPSATGGDSPVALHLGPPRIAPLWEAFDPMAMTGSVTYAVTPDAACFTWRVRAAGTLSPTRGNHFTCELRANGDVVFHYAGHVVPSGTIGIAPGWLPVSGPLHPAVDFSALVQGARHVGAPGQPVYESFPQSGLDVMTFFVPRLTFTPNAAGGYDAFSGTR